MPLLENPITACYLSERTRPRMRAKQGKPSRASQRLRHSCCSKDIISGSYWRRRANNRPSPKTNPTHNEPTIHLLCIALLRFIFAACKAIHHKSGDQQRNTPQTKTQPTPKTPSAAIGFGHLNIHHIGKPRHHVKTPAVGSQ